MSTKRINFMSIFKRKASENAISTKERIVGFRHLEGKNISISKSTPTTIAQYKKRMITALKRGLIFEVTSIDQALMAESAGATAVLVKPPNGDTDLDVLIKSGIIEDYLKELKLPIIYGVKMGDYDMAMELQGLGIDLIIEYDNYTKNKNIEKIDPQEFQIPIISTVRYFEEGLEAYNKGSFALVNDTITSFQDLIKWEVEYSTDSQCFNNYTCDELTNLCNELGLNSELSKNLKQKKGIEILNLAQGFINSPHDLLALFKLGCNSVIVDNSVFDKFSDQRALVSLLMNTIQNYDNPSLLKYIFDQFYELK